MNKGRIKVSIAATLLCMSASAMAVREIVPVTESVVKVNDVNLKVT